MREPIHERREIVFSRTEMDAVFEMVISCNDSEPRATAAA